MALKPIVLTSEGLHKLEQELEQLKTIRRKEVSEKIKVALSFGDLSENSEYDEAKNEQAMVEARIAEIEQMFKVVTVLDEEGITTDTISVGSVVTVKNLKSDRVDTYKMRLPRKIRKFLTNLRWAKPCWDTKWAKQWKLKHRLEP